MQIIGKPLSFVGNNITSFMGGRTDPWKGSEERIALDFRRREKWEAMKEFRSQSSNDGVLELNVFYSMVDFARKRMFRLAQAEGPFTFKYNSFNHEFVSYLNVDGEAYRLENPSKVTVSLATDTLTKGCIRLLVRNLI